MGKLHGGVCYGTSLEAYLSACQSSYPRFGGSSGAVTSTTCEPNASGFTLTTVGAGPVIVDSVLFTLADCEEFTNYEQVAELFGLLLVAVLMVYLMKRFVFRLVANQ